MVVSGAFTSEAQHQNKSARTRARLMDAAVEVFARDGFQAASVNEIARMAGVVNGTFYVHFKDKDEIATRVAARIAADVIDQITSAMTDMTDALERFSFATRQFIEFATTQPQWCWVMIRAQGFHPELLRQLSGHLGQDLELGRRQGQIETEIDLLLIDIIVAMMLVALSARLRGEAGPEAGARLSELVLTMLKVAPDHAKEIAWKDYEFKRLHLTPLPRAGKVKAIGVA